jgi:type III secretion system chaperone SycN
MSWIEATLKDYGSQLGLPSLSLQPHGHVMLELQSGGVLGIEPAQGVAREMLVYIGRPLGFDGPAMLRRALARAHYGSANPVSVQVAVRGRGPDALLLAVARMPEREFTTSGLAQVVDYLRRWTDGVRHD